MNEAINAATLLVTAAGVISAASVLLATSRITMALPVLFDMLLAASILRLVIHQTPNQILSTALLVLIKQVASSGVRRASAARALSTRART